MNAVERCSPRSTVSGGHMRGTKDTKMDEKKINNNLLLVSSSQNIRCSLELRVLHFSIFILLLDSHSHTETPYRTYGIC